MLEMPKQKGGAPRRKSGTKSTGRKVPRTKGEKRSQGTVMSAEILIGT